MRTYDLIADLPVRIDDYALEGLDQHVSSDFTRRTTVVHLHGNGESGHGEDVAWDSVDQHRERITWDADFHSVADLEALPFAPRMVNFKPSRIGSLERLLDAYDYVEAHGIGGYGGGMFELGPGRGQIQYLASLFHPDAPNDTSPAGFHEREPPDDLPGSPLQAAPPQSGFRWG